MEKVLVMEEYTVDIKKILLERLENKGVESNIIPRFLKDLINLSLDDPFISLFQVNNRMHLLGWNEVKLDYHTYQLAKAYFEKNNKERWQA